MTLIPEYEGTHTVDGVEFSCRHLCPKTRVRQLESLVKNHKLIVDGGFVCDSLIPVSVAYAVGQGVHCVGPKSPNCPHPDEAVVIADNSV